MSRTETALHRALKSRHALATGGEVEVDVRLHGKTYRIDVLNRASGDACEVQREHFGPAFYTKIQALSNHFNVTIIHPVPVIQHVTTWEREHATRKVSRKRQDVYSIFERLVSFKAPDVIGTIQLRVLLVEEHVTRRFVGVRGKRPCHEVLSRDLVRIVEERVFASPADYLSLIPSGLPGSFTNSDLAALLDIKGGTARKKKIAACMTYSLCQLGLVWRTGKLGNAHVFCTCSRPRSFTSHARDAGACT